MVFVLAPNGIVFIGIRNEIIESLASPIAEKVKAINGINRNIIVKIISGVKEVDLRVVGVGFLSLQVQVTINDLVAVYSEVIIESKGIEDRPNPTVN